MRQENRVELLIAVARKMALFAALLSSAAFAENSMNLERVARIQGFRQNVKSTSDIFDRGINSPKSALFSADGTKLYINSLEGHETLVYGWPVLKKLNTISHSFDRGDASLFGGENSIFGYRYFQTEKQAPDVNVFKGKPVEMTLSHGGRFLWITYYRRSFDPWAQSPSAVAIIDTRTDQILRVMPTGPIPKYVAASADGRFVAITHWGDNTIGLIDTSSGDPARFQYVSQLIVEGKLTQEGKAKTDRDSTCGFCLRGTVFTKDSQFLFVARMGGGGLAAFHVPSRKYLGSVMAVKATPRHLAITPDGRDLVVSNNVSGYVSKKSVSSLIEDFVGAHGKRVNGGPWREVEVGSGARTLEISHDGKIAYTAVNKGTRLVAVDLALMKVVGLTPLDPYPVGLAISRDGNYIAVTSQGVKGHGGNAVNIVRVRGGAATPEVVAKESWKPIVEQTPVEKIEEKEAPAPVKRGPEPREESVERKPRSETLGGWLSRMFRQ